MSSPRLALQRHQLPFQTLLSCCLFSEAANLCISQPRLRSNFDHGASSYTCNQCGQREEQALPWNHILPATVQVTLPPEMHHSDVLAHWSHGCESRNYPWHRDASKSKWSISQCAWCRHLSPHRPLEIQTLPSGRLQPQQQQSSPQLARALQSHGLCVCVFPSTAIDLLYWRDIKQTGIVFGSFLLLLFSLTQFSVVSVVAYLALAALSATISFRIYKSVLQAVQKTDEGHPFK